MPDRISIDFISVMGMPPVDFVELTARLGVRQIGLASRPIVSNPHGYPEWSLLDDVPMQRAVRDALAANDVSVALGEGFLIMPGADIAVSAPLFDLMAFLGAERVNVACIEPDRARNFDQIAQFAAMAAERGLKPVLEFAPIMSVTDLPMALDAVAHAARPGFGVLIDALHLARSGGTVADVAALDPALIGYVQLCDGPADWTMDSYMDEARFNRLCPGEGAFPLAALVAAVPGDVPLGLEIPMQSVAEAGIGPAERLAPSIAAVEAMLR